MYTVVSGDTELLEMRGDTIEKELTFTDSNGTAIDITTWLVTFTVKDNIDDTDADAIVQKKYIGGLHSDPTNGKTKITLTASETYSLVGSYQYDVQLVKPDGTVKTIMKDKIKFSKDVTRDTD